jgi:4-hydroxy-4-methyl-2-oxoglutarate aldolase
MIGFRVVTGIERPPASLSERLGHHRSCDLSDSMSRAGTMVGIKPVYTPIASIAGPAVTVSIPAGGINMIKLGIEQAQAGDVLVVSAQGETTYAMMGGNISLGMQARGLAGFIIDGAVRDVSELRELGFPTFARGVATAAGDLGGPRGEVNVPIACGSVVVNPGDIVVADEDGIVVVPPEAAEDVMAAAEALHSTHAKAREVLRTGAVTSIEQVTAAFKQQGLAIGDGDHT